MLCSNEKRAKKKKKRNEEKFGLQDLTSLGRYNRQEYGVNKFSFKFFHTHCQI